MGCDVGRSKDGHEDIVAKKKERERRKKIHSLCGELLISMCRYTMMRVSGGLGAIGCLFIGSGAAAGRKRKTKNQKKKKTGIEEKTKKSGILAVGC